MLEIGVFVATVFPVLLTAQTEKPFEKTRIFPLQPQHAHGSSLEELPNGDLLAVWFQGSGERQADDVAIMGARYRQANGTWSQPFVMADQPGFPDTNPVVFLDKKERLWLIWYTVLANQWETSLLRYRISEDFQQEEGVPVWSWQDVILLQPGGSTERGIQPDDPFVLSVQEQLNHHEKYVVQTLAGVPSEQRQDLWRQWQGHKQAILARASGEDLIARGRVQLPDGTYEQLPMPYPRFRRLGWQSRNKPFQYEDGRIVLPLYSDGLEMSIMAITDDYGKHWQVSQPLVAIANIQPTMALRKDGTLVAYMRDNGPPPQRIPVSTSPDRGKTWTPVEDSELPNPGSAADVVVMQNGHWALVYNDTEDGRHRLAVSISTDEGHTWPYTRYLEADETHPPASRSHYPAIIQARDGRLHVSYSYHLQGSPEAKTIVHAAFDPAWVMDN